MTNLTAAASPQLLSLLDAEVALLAAERDTVAAALRSRQSRVRHATHVAWGTGAERCAARSELVEAFAAFDGARAAQRSAEQAWERAFSRYRHSLGGAA